MPNNIKTDADLRKMIEKAKEHVMTPEEMRRQRAGFVWGNMSEKSASTRQEIEKRIADNQG